MHRRLAIRRHPSTSVIIGLVALGLCVAGPRPAAAQGLRAGLAFNELTDLAGFESRQGFAFGASFSVLRFGAVAVTPELLYVQKGAKRSTASPSGIDDIRIDWFEIPVLLRVGSFISGTPVRPSAYGGIYYAFESGCSFGFADGGDRSEGCTFVGLQEIGINGGISDNTAGWVVGGAVEYFVERIGLLSIDARYTASFSAITRRGSESRPKTRTFIIMAGWAPSFR